VKFAFIHAEKARLPVTRLCEALDVSPSGYYAWALRPPSQRAMSDSKLVPVIRACHVRSRGTYGSPRIHQDLRALGHRVSRKRVARLMRREGVSARPPRRYRATTDSKHPLPVAPNVVARKFHTDGPNRVWVTDITYVWTWEGWLFLAAIVDIFSRQRGRGDLLRDSQGRTDLPTSLAHEERGQDGDPRLHRCLLQPQPPSLVPRLPQSDGLRTATRCRNRGSITALSTESGQLQPQR